jgi:hypothetical protein
MTSDPRTRASDQDRERAAAALGGNYAAGRLTLEEFQERLDQAYAAKALGELDGLMADLPGTDLGQLPDTRPPRSGGHPSLPEQRAPAPVQAPGGGHYVVLPLWLAITLGAFVILMISGAGGGAWFLWMVVLLAFIMLRHRIMSGPRRTREHRDDHQSRP